LSSEERERERYVKREGEREGRCTDLTSSWWGEIGESADSVLIAIFIINLHELDEDLNTLCLTKQIMEILLIRKITQDLCSFNFGFQMRGFCHRENGREGLLGFVRMKLISGWQCLRGGKEAIADQNSWWEWSWSCCRWDWGRSESKLKFIENIPEWNTVTLTMKEREGEESMGVTGENGDWDWQIIDCLPEYKKKNLSKDIIQIYIVMTHEDTLLPTETHRERETVSKVRRDRNREDRNWELTWQVSWWKR
jgi:hypothetical protein